MITGRQLRLTRHLLKEEVEQDVKEMDLKPHPITSKHYAAVELMKEYYPEISDDDADEIVRDSMTDDERYELEFHLNRHYDD